MANIWNTGRPKITKPIQSSNAFPLEMLDPTWGQDVEADHVKSEADNTIVNARTGEAIALDKEDNQCMICLEEITESRMDETELLVCGHRFFKDCIAQWRVDGKNNSCPTCREIHLDDSEYPKLG